MLFHQTKGYQLYFLIFLFSIVLKLSDDTDDIFKNKKLNCKLSGINLTLLMILLLFDNIYLFPIVLLMFTFGIFLVPNGFYDLEFEWYLVTTYSLMVIILNYKRYNLNSIFFTLIIVLSTFIWFLNEKTNILLRYNIIKPIFVDKEVSKKKILYRLIGSLFLLFQFGYLNKYLFNKFDIKDNNSLIASNVVVLGVCGYLITSVIDQIYSYFFIDDKLWRKKSRLH